MADEFNISDSPATTDPQLLADTADIKLNTDNLDVSLSTRASESTLSSVDASSAATALAVASSASAIGDPTDAAAGSDTGTFSLISLFKRSLTKLQSLIDGRHDNVSVIASSSYTATQDSADFTNKSARGLHIVLDVTAGSGHSITPRVQAKDSITGKYYDVLVGKTFSDLGLKILKIYPGVPAVKDAVVNDVLPRTWRVRVEHGDATAVTYSVSANLLH